MATFETGTGQTLYNVHTKQTCAGEHCPLHKPSSHAKSIGRTHWRGDRGIMERICKHGVGHPDPDVELPDYELVHGCDGCCR